MFWNILVFGMAILGVGFLVWAMFAKPADVDTYFEDIREKVDVISKTGETDAAQLAKDVEQYVKTKVK